MKNKINYEIAWLQQLVHEYEMIVFQHTVGLKKPSFIISDSKKIFGTWDPIARTISISRYFIENYPWFQTIEVLKHEMAHQYVSEILHEQSCHGRAFKTACKKLGVHAEFCKPNIDSDALKAFNQSKQPSTESEKMLMKVEKLLALSQSCNENEARAASKKANELIIKHNLELLFNNENRQEALSVYLVITHKKKRIESLQKSIVSILRDFYFIDSVTTTLYDPRDNKSYRSIVLFGTPENLKVAKYVYDYLLRTGKTLWGEYKKKYKASMKEKVSFDMGFTGGVRETLKKHTVIKTKKTHTTLPVPTFQSLSMDMQDLNRIEVARVFPKLSHSTYGTHYKNDAYNTGFSQGKQTTINKGIHNKERHIAGLLN